MAYGQDRESPLHPEQFRQLHEETQQAMEELAQHGLTYDPHGALNVKGHVFPSTSGMLVFHEGAAKTYTSAIPSEESEGTEINYRQRNPGEDPLIEVRKVGNNEPIVGERFHPSDPELVPHLRSVASRRGVLSQQQARSLADAEQGTVGKLSVMKYHPEGSIQGTYDTRTGRMSDAKFVKWNLED